MADGKHKLLDAQLTPRIDGTATLQLVGEMDMSSATTLADQFVAISAQRLDNLILDATRVSFIDSAGIHALTEGKQMIQAQDTRITLVPSPRVSRLLELTGSRPWFALEAQS